MRRLMLLRHAKSSWNDPGVDDHDRPLSDRGHRDAPLIGAWLARHALQPDAVLCSTALRARQTCEHVLRALPAAPSPRLLKALYTFGGEGPLTAAIRRHGGDARTLLLVGHNNAMHNLAAALAATGAPKPLARLRRKYPTAALSVFALDIDDWRDFAPFGGHLEHFVRPKDLRGKA